MTPMKPPRAQKYRRDISISDLEWMSCSWPQLHTSTMGKGQIKQKTTILGSGGIQRQLIIPPRN